MAYHSMLCGSEDLILWPSHKALTQIESPVFDFYSLTRATKVSI